MKKVILSLSVLLFSAILNFGLFSVAYNRLATPYLHESQRVDNAELIMFYVLPAYLALAIVSYTITYILIKKLQE